MRGGGIPKLAGAAGWRTVSGSCQDDAPPQFVSYHRHYFAAALISHAAWLYHLFSLSLHDVEFDSGRVRRPGRLRLLIWDGSGLCLVTKRLESGAFTWPPVRDGAVTLNAAQLRLLFSGMDWTQIGTRTIPMATQ
jgi:hypothetical protein